MPYDAAMQHFAMATELRASRRAHTDLVRLRNDLFAFDAHTAERLDSILREWDATPKAVLDHEPDQPHPTSKER